MILKLILLVYFPLFSLSYESQLRYNSKFFLKRKKENKYTQSKKTKISKNSILEEDFCQENLFDEACHTQKKISVKKEGRVKKKASYSEFKEALERDEIPFNDLYSYADALYFETYDKTQVKQELESLLDIRSCNYVHYSSKLKESLKHPVETEVYQQSSSPLKQSLKEIIANALDASGEKIGKFGRGGKQDLALLEEDGDTLTRWIKKMGEREVLQYRIRRVKGHLAVCIRKYDLQQSVEHQIWKDVFVDEMSSGTIWQIKKQSKNLKRADIEEVVYQSFPLCQQTELYLNGQVDSRVLYTMEGVPEKQIRNIQMNEVRVQTGYWYEDLTDQVVVIDKGAGMTVEDLLCYYISPHGSEKKSDINQDCYQKMKSNYNICDKEGFPDEIVICVNGMKIKSISVNLNEGDKKVWYIDIGQVQALRESREDNSLELTKEVSSIINTLFEENILLNGTLTPRKKLIYINILYESIQQSFFQTETEKFQLKSMGLFLKDYAKKIANQEGILLIAKGWGKTTANFSGRKVFLMHPELMDQENIQKIHSILQAKKVGEFIFDNSKNKKGVFLVDFLESKEIFWEKPLSCQKNDKEFFEDESGIYLPHRYENSLVNSQNKGGVKAIEVLLGQRGLKGHLSFFGEDKKRETPLNEEMEFERSSKEPDKKQKERREGRRKDEALESVIEELWEEKPSYNERMIRPMTFMPSHIIVKEQLINGDCIVVDWNRVKRKEVYFSQIRKYDQLHVDTGVWVSQIDISKNKQRVIYRVEKGEDPIRVYSLKDNQEWSLKLDKEAIPKGGEMYFFDDEGKNLYIEQGLKGTKNYMDVYAYLVNVDQAIQKRVKENEMMEIEQIRKESRKRFLTQTQNSQKVMMVPLYKKRENLQDLSGVKAEDIIGILRSYSFENPVDFDLEKLIKISPSELKEKLIEKLKYSEEEKFKILRNHDLKRYWCGGLDEVGAYKKEGFIIEGTKIDLEGQFVILMSRKIVRVDDFMKQSGKIEINYQKEDKKLYLQIVGQGRQVEIMCSQFIEEDCKYLLGMSECEDEYFLDEDDDECDEDEEEEELEEDSIFDKWFYIKIEELEENLDNIETFLIQCQEDKEKSNVIVSINVDEPRLCIANQQMMSYENFWKKYETTGECEDGVFVGKEAYFAGPCFLWLRQKDLISLKELVDEDFDLGQYQNEKKIDYKISFNHVEDMIFMTNCENEQENFHKVLYEESLKKDKNWESENYINLIIPVMEGLLPTRRWGLLQQMSNHRKEVEYYSSFLGLTKKEGELIAFYDRADRIGHSGYQPRIFFQCPFKWRVEEFDSEKGYRSYVSRVEKDGRLFNLLGSSKMNEEVELTVKRMSQEKRKAGQSLKELIQYHHDFINEKEFGMVNFLEIESFLRRKAGVSQDKIDLLFQPIFQEKHLQSLLEYAIWLSLVDLCESGNEDYELWVEKLYHQKNTLLSYEKYSELSDDLKLSYFRNHLTARYDEILNFRKDNEQDRIFIQCYMWDKDQLTKERVSQILVIKEKLEKILNRESLVRVFFKIVSNDKWELEKVLNRIEKTMENEEEAIKLGVAIESYFSMKDVEGEAHKLLKMIQTTEVKDWGTSLWVVYLKFILSVDEDFLVYQEGWPESKDSLSMSELRFLYQEHVNNEGEMPQLSDLWEAVQNRQIDVLRSREYEREMEEEMNSQRMSYDYNIEFVQNAIDGQAQNVMFNYYKEEVVQDNQIYLVEEMKDDSIGFSNWFDVLISKKSTKMNKDEMIGCFGRGALTYWSGCRYLKMECCHQGQKETAWFEKREECGEEFFYLIHFEKSIAEEETQQGVTVKRYLSNLENSPLELLYYQSVNSLKENLGAVPFEKIKISYGINKQKVEYINDNKVRKVQEKDGYLTQNVELGQHQDDQERDQVWIRDGSGLGISKVSIEHPYFDGIHKDFKKEILKEKLIFYISKPLIRDRSRFANEEKVLPWIQAEIALSFYRYLCEKIIQDKQYLKEYSFIKEGMTTERQKKLQDLFKEYQHITDIKEYLKKLNGLSKEDFLLFLCVFKVGFKNESEQWTTLKKEVLKPQNMHYTNVVLKDIHQTEEGEILDDILFLIKDFLNLFNIKVIDREKAKNIKILGKFYKNENREKLDESEEQLLTLILEVLKLNGLKKIEEYINQIDFLLEGIEKEKFKKGELSKDLLYKNEKLLEEKKCLNNLFTIKMSEKEWLRNYQFLKESRYQEIWGIWKDVEEIEGYLKQDDKRYTWVINPSILEKRKESIYHLADSLAHIFSEGWLSSKGEKMTLHSYKHNCNTLESTSLKEMREQILHHFIKKLFEKSENKEGVLKDEKVGSGEKEESMEEESWDLNREFEEKVTLLDIRTHRKRKGVESEKEESIKRRCEEDQENDEMEQENEWGNWIQTSQKLYNKRLELYA